jgi:hypothetical protein
MTIFCLPEEEHSLKFLHAILPYNGIFEQFKTILEFDLSKITDMLMPVQVAKSQNYENGLLEFYIKHFNIHLDFLCYYIDMINFQIKQRNDLEKGIPLDKLLVLEKQEAYFLNLRKAIQEYENLENTEFKQKNKALFSMKYIKDVEFFEKEINSILNQLLKEIKRLKITNLKLSNENNILALKLNEILNKITNFENMKIDEKLKFLQDTALEIKKRKYKKLESNGKSQIIKIN